MSITKEGTIQGFKQTKNGKPMVVIDGQNYFLGKTVLTADVGDRISFEASAFGERGDLWGINKWGKLPNGTAGTVSSTSSPTTPVEGAVSRLDMSEGERLCVSNWIGQAIGAGTIKDPIDIEIWVSASRNALKAQR